MSALGISFCPTDASARSTRASVSRQRRPKLGCNRKLPRRILDCIWPNAHWATSCLASEQRTRDGLNKNRPTFPADDRIDCVKSHRPCDLPWDETRRQKKREANPADTNPRRWPPPTCSSSTPKATVGKRLKLSLKDWMRSIARGLRENLDQRQKSDGSNTGDW